MPSWKEHMKFCMEHGIDKDVCDFANRLVDFPEEMIPKLLKDRKLKEYLAQKLDFTLEELNKIAKETEMIWKIKTGKICNECSFRDKCKFKDLKNKPKYAIIGKNYCAHIIISVRKNGVIPMKRIDRINEKYAVDIRDNSKLLDNFLEYRRICPIPTDYLKDNPNAVYHEKLHTYSDYNRCLELIKEIAHYFYGKKGVEAVELHLKLDETSHILGKLKQRIPAFLSRKLHGKVRDRNTGKYISVSNFIRKYIYKDPNYMIKALQPENKWTLKNNISKLLSMTVKEFLQDDYNGILKDKKIIEIIQEYKDRFGKFPQLIKMLR